MLGYANLSLADCLVVVVAVSVTMSAVVMVMAMTVPFVRINVRIVTAVESGFSQISLAPNRESRHQLVGVFAIAFRTFALIRISR